MKKTILITLAVGGALALLLAILLFLGPTYTANWDTEPVRINIPQDCTYDDLRDTLDAHEVVIRKTPAAIVFDLEARAVGLTKHVRPGSYLVPRNMEMHAFVRKLRNGQQDPIRLTIGKFRLPQQLNEYLNQKLMHDDFDVPLDSFHLVLQDTYEVYWTITPEQFMQRMEKESAAYWQQTVDSGECVVGSHTEQALHTTHSTLPTVCFADRDMADFTAEMYAEGHSFFTYISDNADSLSSCCRLRNEITDNGFSYTLGAGGVSTGSKSVLTINLNRCIQYAVNHDMDYREFLTDIIDLCHKVQLAYNENLKDLQAHGMLPLFDAGYINIARQYLTIGVNGLVEAAEFMGIPITDNPQYREFVQTVLGLVEKKNKEYRTKEVMFNCEMIPAENVGVKHAKWDREDGYFVPRDCYNSYFYIVEDASLTVLDKFRLHGAPYIEHLTGGSALHCNLEEHLTQQQYRQLLDVAAKEGCNYFTFNIPNTICNDCGHIDKRYLKECPKCHSHNVDYLTRVIGYLRRVSNFSKPRQEEASRRFYASM